MPSTEEMLAVYQQGWQAMRWLAEHAKQRCSECLNYRRRVEQYGNPQRYLSLRCAAARKAHGEYMQVEKMRLEGAEDFECVLHDPARPYIVCEGPAEWALTERRVDGKQLIAYDISCHKHAMIKHREIFAGQTRMFSVERLSDLSTEEASKMR